MEFFFKLRQHSEECMCQLRNIHVAMRDYQESVTSGQTDGQTNTEQSDPYVPLCFAGNTKIKRFIADFQLLTFLNVLFL